MPVKHQLIKDIAPLNCNKDIISHQTENQSTDKLMQIINSPEFSDSIQKRTEEIRIALKNTTNQPMSTKSQPIQKFHLGQTVYYVDPTYSNIDYECIKNYKELITKATIQSATLDTSELIPEVYYCLDFEGETVESFYDYELAITRKKCEQKLLNNLDFTKKYPLLFATPEEVILDHIKKALTACCNKHNISEEQIQKALKNIIN